MGGATQGAWFSSAKTMAFVGDTEKRAYKIAFGLAYYIETRYGYCAIYCPPDMDPEQGARVPLQSLKLHAEVAVLGARSLAGDILLHPDCGFMYYGSVFTEMPRPPDQPLSHNPCPAPSCVQMYCQTGQTPCMKFSPVSCLSGSIHADGLIAEMHFAMHKCAEMSCSQKTRSHLSSSAYPLTGYEFCKSL